MEKPNGKEEIFKYQESLNEIAQKHNLDERTKFVVAKLFSFVEKGDKKKAESLLKKQLELSNWFKDESLVPIILEDIQDYVDLRKMEESEKKEEPAPNEPNVQNSENAVILPEEEPSDVLNMPNIEEDKTGDINESIDSLAKEISGLRAQGLDEEVLKKEEEFQKLLKERDIIEAGNPKPKKPQNQKPPKAETSIKPAIKKEDKKKIEPKKTLSSFAELKEYTINMPNERPPQNNKNNSENRNQDRSNSRPFEQRKEVEFNQDGSPRRIAGYTGEEVADIVEKTTSRKNKKENVDTTNTESNSQKENTSNVNNSVVISLASKIVDGNALSGPEKQQLKKYEEDVLAKVEEIHTENEKNTSLREEIIQAENEGKKLTPKQKVFLSRPGESKIIEDLRQKNLADKEARVAEEARLAEESRAAEEARVDEEARLAEESRTASEAAAKEAATKSEREAFGKLDRTGKRAKAMERYQQMVDKKTENMNEDELRDFQYDSQAKRDNANARRSAGYERVGREYQEILNNKEYQKLKSNKDNLGPSQKEVLAQYENKISNIKSKANSFGPLGSGYISLEEARAGLAKSSQEYKHSFKRKFFGSRALAGISNMFGFKYSGIKEGENTKAAQNSMSEAQAKYDNFRQKIMQGTLSEEYDVNRVVKIGNENIADRMRNIVTCLDRELIVREQQKLEDLKHVLEETVKKPAFLQFANWYKNNYWGAIKNPRVRRIVQRTTNALILSGAIFATGGAAGVAVGVAGAKGLISGTVGEAAAMGVAGLAGGSKNDRGEFVNFAAKRDEDRQKFANIMNNAITEQILAGSKPDASREIFKARVDGEERANIDMQMREMRVRKGEMWARLLAGGALGGYLMHEMVPNPTILPTPAPEITPQPIVDDFRLEGDFVDASPQGSIQTFMNLKKEMIAHYKGLDAGQFKYTEANEFANLTDDQVAEKLLATGKFDDFTTDIMSAKTLPEFMKVAEEHGFWKPEGWGNSAIDSASVPAGSKIGMDVGTDGNMHFMMILPDGKHIPIDDNFQEALNQHIKGVGMIDSHIPGRAVGVSSDAVVSPGSVVDSSLDAGDMPASTSPAPDADVVIESRGAAGGLIENSYFKDYPIDFSSRLSAYKSLIQNGYTVEVQGDGFTPMQISNVDKINFDRATAFIVNGDKYFLDGFNNIPADGKVLQEDFVFGMDANGKYITMDDYNKFHNLGQYKPAPASDIENIQTNTNADANADIETSADDNFDQIIKKYEDDPSSQKFAHEFLDGHFGKDVVNDDVYGTEHLDETKSELWNDLKSEKIGHVHKALDQQEKIGAERLAFDDGDFYSKAEMKQTNVFFNELVEKYQKIYGVYPTSEKTVHDVVKAVAVGSAGSSR